MQNNKTIKDIINSYRNDIQGVIRRYIPSQFDIDDVEQEVYLKTWKNISKFRGDSTIWGWIRKITVNACIDHVNLVSKRQNNLMGTDDSLEKVADNSVSYMDRIIKKERQKFILSEINNLKPKLKEVIILYDIENLSYEEISQKINCPVGTVKSRLFNARKALAIELKELLN